MRGRRKNLGETQDEKRFNFIEKIAPLVIKIVKKKTVFFLNIKTTLYFKNTLITIRGEQKFN